MVSLAREQSVAMEMMLSFAPVEQERSFRKVMAFPASLALLV